MLDRWRGVDEGRRTPAESCSTNGASLCPDFINQFSRALGIYAWVPFLMEPTGERSYRHENGIPSRAVMCDASAICPPDGLSHHGEHIRQRRWYKPFERRSSTY